MKVYVIRIIGILIFTLSLSCVNTDDFDLPEIESTPVEFSGDTTSIAAVKSNYNFETGEIYTFQNTGIYMPGYVISSDEAGNFYKKLVVQDKSSTPGAGIQILLDDNSLFETYDFGRKIYVKLDGLSLWFNNGVLQLGIQNRGDVVAIPFALIDDHIIRTSEKAEIIPLDLEISEFSEAYKNLFIRLENVQFNRNLVKESHRFTFAGESIDQYDGERQLESCITGATTRVSTSTYSNFKSLLLPEGSGSLEGVLTRNFYDDHFVVVLNSPAELNLSGDRCDPEFFECGTSSIQGPEVIFEENFNSVTTTNKLSSMGWTNINVNGGAKRFELGNLSGNKYMRISAYNSQEAPFEAWLVSPAIDMNESTGEILSFEILASYDNASILEVYVSTEFTGNPLTTTWQLLDANIPVGPSSQYGKTYKKTEIDVSCLQGEMYLAFRYLGAAPDKTTTYDIDNIRLTGY